MAKQPLGVIEQCKSFCDNTQQVVYDTIHHVMFDTMHVSLDSVISYNVFEKTQEYFENFYTNINSSLSYATTWVGVLFAIISLFAVLKIFWEIKGGVLLFRKYSKEIKNENEALIKKFIMEHHYCTK